MRQIEKFFALLVASPYQGVRGFKIRVLGQRPKAVSTVHRFSNAVPTDTVCSDPHVLTAVMQSARRIRLLTPYKDKINLLPVVKGVLLLSLSLLLQVLASVLRACLTYLTEYCTTDTPLLSRCGLPLSVNSLTHS